MKLFLTIIRWVFGVTLCLSSFGGFASGEIGFGLLVLVLGLLLIPPITKNLLKKIKPDHNKRETIQSNSASFSSKNFKPQVNNMKFPSRVDTILWHTNAIKRGFESGDLDFTNLSYAKLIESVRQQSINEKGTYDYILKSIRKEYEQFRLAYNLEYPQQFLPPSERNNKKEQLKYDSTDSEKLVNITTKSEGKNTTVFTIDLNEKEFINRVKNGTLGKEKYKKDIEDITGFYGTEKYSSNGAYCVSYSEGYYNDDKWKNGDIALVKGKTVLYKKKLQRPNECAVSNNGIVICCDYLNSDESIGKIIIFDIKGEVLFTRKTKANLGMCSISDNGTIALFETYGSENSDSNSIFLVDTVTKLITAQFERSYAFNSASIDSDSKLIQLKNHKGFIFEIDFEGNQTNLQDYENQIMTKGSTYDRLCLFQSKTDEEKFKDKGYLNILKSALTDKDASYSFGQDRIYRMLGEFYEANNDIEKTIENWEKAVQINPKVGIKRKLDSLKKQL